MSAGAWGNVFAKPPRGVPRPVALRLRVSAVALTTVSGYVDALGYLSLGGFFVSFMSGTSTRFAIGVGTASHAAAVAGLLLAAFLTGVVVGSFIAQLSRQRSSRGVLLAVAAVLALSAVVGSTGMSRLATTLMAGAMGIENAVFLRDPDMHIGVTYVTGTLVKLGEGIAAALRGGTHRAWMWYLLLWVGLVTGAAVASMVFPDVGLRGLWAAVVVLAVLAFMVPVEPEPATDGGGATAPFAIP